MPIQFECESCHKLIEVDDEWAGRLVECPFCRTAVRAPGGHSVERPTMTAAPATPPAPYPVDLPGMDRPRFDDAAPMYPGDEGGRGPRQTNRLAVVGLVLACLGVALFLGLSVFVVFKAAAAMAPPGAGFEETAEYIDNMDPEEFQNQVQKIIMDSAERGESWAVMSSLGILAGGGFWLAGLICSLIAVTRQKWRWVAVMGLLVSAAPLMFIVLSAL